MSRRRIAQPISATCLEAPPPRPPLGVATLRHAPELASLALLDDALGLALVALGAEHPTVEDLPAAGEPPSLRHARAVIAAVFRLRRVLWLYRNAVYAAITPVPSSHDDLPF